MSEFLHFEPVKYVTVEPARGADMPCMHPVNKADEYHPDLEDETHRPSSPSSSDQNFL